MTMSDWIKATDDLLKFRRKQVLKDSGKISHKQAIEKAKKAPCIFNNWANFYKGEFISNTILNANSFEKLIK